MSESWYSSPEIQILKFETWNSNPLTLNSPNIEIVIQKFWPKKHDEFIFEFLDSGKWNAGFWKLDLAEKVDSCTVGLGSGNFEGKCCPNPTGYFIHYNSATNCCNEDGSILSIGECT